MCVCVCDAVCKCTMYTGMGNDSHDHIPYHTQWNFEMSLSFPASERSTW